MNTMRFGLHYMLDGYGGSKEKLSDIDFLENLLGNLVEKMGMHMIAEPKVVEVGPQNKKDPGGCSGFVLIAESHISFHTFPERGFITADVYTCQDELDTEKLTEIFRSDFELDDCDTFIKERGVKYPKSNITE